MGATTSVESATKGATSSAAISFLKSSPKKLLIGGKWVASKSSKTFETLNPSNEEVLALVAEGDKADVDEAVKHARADFGIFEKHLVEIAEAKKQNRVRHALLDAEILRHQGCLLE